MWLGPIALLAWLVGGDQIFPQMGWFFAKMAVITFGGAYAVLSYVAQQAVPNYGWLTTAKMIDGLPLAETNPGPLILVLTFVGFYAAHQQPGTLTPMLARTLGAIFAAVVGVIANLALWFALHVLFENVEEISIARRPSSGRTGAARI